MKDLYRDSGILFEYQSRLCIYTPSQDPHLGQPLVMPSSSQVFYKAERPGLSVKINESGLYSFICDLTFASNKNLLKETSNLELLFVWLEWKKEKYEFKNSIITLQTKDAMVINTIILLFITLIPAPEKINTKNPLQILNPLITPSDPICFSICDET